MSDFQLGLLIILNKAFLINIFFNFIALIFCIFLIKREIKYKYFSFCFALCCIFYAAMFFISKIVLNNIGGI